MRQCEVWCEHCEANLSDRVTLHLELPSCTCILHTLRPVHKPVDLDSAVQYAHLDHWVSTLTNTYGNTTNLCQTLMLLHKTKCRLMTICQSIPITLLHLIHMCHTGPLLIKGMQYRTGILGCNNLVWSHTKTCDQIQQVSQKQELKSN